MRNTVIFLCVVCLSSNIVFNRIYASPGVDESAKTEPATDASVTRRPNVLLIAIDDLNDWVGCLGGHSQSRTPHIDALSKRGVLFANAHCQAPICNPSRTSLMTGVRPSTSGIYLNSPWFRSTALNRERVTLPQYFAKHGYRTLTTGKIYHGSHRDELSFETVGPTPGQRNRLDQRIQTELKHGGPLWDFGPQKFDEASFNDVVTSDWAVKHLKASTEETPFFLAVGLVRPHVPFYAPQRHFENRPLEKVLLPEVKEDDRIDLPPSAIELTNNTRPPSHQWFEESGKWSEAVQAYLACITFVDEQVGRMMKALDEGPHADNTIVVLFSDHGFHLGEKQRWAKQSLWESSTQVPLIILTPEGNDGRCERPVELLNLYPTLIELCGLPSREGLEGVSLVPLISDPATAWERPAITTYQRENHAVRSERYRYIRYADGSEELYDHDNDPNEWQNLLSDTNEDRVDLKAKYSGIIAEHARWLPKRNAPDQSRIQRRRLNGIEPGSRSKKKD